MSNGYGYGGSSSSSSSSSGSRTVTTSQPTPVTTNVTESTSYSATPQPVQRRIASSTENLVARQGQLLYPSGEEYPAGARYHIHPGRGPMEGAFHVSTSHSVLVYANEVNNETTQVKQVSTNKYYNPYERDPASSSVETVVEEIFIKPPEPKNEFIIKDMIISKNIDDLSIYYADVSGTGGLNSILITGDVGSQFYLEVKNEDSNYYNFHTNTFTSTYAKLEDEIVSPQGYLTSIVFPQVFDDDQYDFSLFTKGKTKHINSSIKKDVLGNIDINRTKGSSSPLLKKVVYQILAVNSTISPFSGNNAVTLNSTTSDVSSFDRGDIKNNKQSFSITGTLTSNAITVDRQPVKEDLLAYKNVELATNPVDIEGENIYPTVTNTDTTNATMSSTDLVTMTSLVATKMKVGDRVTGTGISADDVVTVLNITDGTTNQFRASQNVSISSGVTLSFSNRVNYRWYADSVDNLEPGMHLLSGTNTVANSVIADYTEKITINANTKEERDIVQVYKPAIDTSDYTPVLSKGIIFNTGNIIFNNQQPLALGGDTIKIGAYGRDQIRRLTGWDVDVSNLSLTLGEVTTTTTADTTNNPSTTIAVTSALGIADETTVTVNMPSSTSQLTKYTLTNVTTVLDSVDGLSVGQTLRAMSVGTLSGNPTILAIDEAEKSITLTTEQTFADNETLTFSNSSVSGIGIDPLVIDPYITNISGTNLTVSAAQALESGQTLTFPGAGSTFTITGDLNIRKVGDSNLTLTLDVDKFLTYHS